METNKPLKLRNAQVNTQFSHSCEVLETEESHPNPAPHATDTRKQKYPINPENPNSGKVANREERWHEGTKQHTGAGAHVAIAEIWPLAAAMRWLSRNQATGRGRRERRRTSTSSACFRFMVWSAIGQLPRCRQICSDKTRILDCAGCTMVAGFWWENGAGRRVVAPLPCPSFLFS